jgi:hypothetical protein
VQNKDTTALHLKDRTTPPRPRGRRGTPVAVSLLSVAMLLSSCDNYRTAATCADHIAIGDRGGFITDDKGLARDPSSDTIWYRCPGGKHFSNYICKGEGLHLNWSEATNYAVEFSEKSGIVWRLPTNDEMKSIIEPSCIAPAINQNVFPSPEVANYWTSSGSWQRKTFKCSVNSYNGSLSCRQPKFVQQPFLLVMDQP